MHYRYLLLCATGLLGACSSRGGPPVQIDITGTASYRERMLLPPDSTLEVTLEDASRADAPAMVVSRTRIPVSTAPPFKFKLPVRLDSIKTNHRYHVRASIIGGGEVMFRSHMGSPVFGPNNILHADITMRREGATPVDAVPPPPQQLRGMYSYMADAGWFVDCLSGVRLAVAQEADNAALETAYSKSRPMPGTQMLATVDGRVEARVQMEPPISRPTLIVDKFISVESQGCSGPSSTAQLENTYWKLMTLEGKSIETPEGAREIHLVLKTQGRRLNGFAGCNGFSGGYSLDGENIQFGDIAGTLMACPVGMEIERRIHEVLPLVSSWKITGETLQFTNAQDVVVATFESRYMK